MKSNRFIALFLIAAVLALVTSPPADAEPLTAITAILAVAFLSTVTLHNAVTDEAPNTTAGQADTETESSG
ncbi:MAG: hypothetical protein ACOWWM_20935 [Desulfobacterales bacterium]